MKIDGINIQKIYESFSKNAESAAEEACATKQDQGADPKDRVEISSKASDMSFARKTAQKQIGVESEQDREARIFQIKNQIESGQYSISSRDVAASIVKGRNFDKNV
ncbi:MAG TPA: flagellar biosynthesis anti-sigma factor FlgM [Clostridia bacterium]|nr:flagellar biosynthesis anti-sigma factor FlgM [Clostridia bacterium]